MVCIYISHLMLCCFLLPLLLGLPLFFELWVYFQEQLKHEHHHLDTIYCNKVSAVNLLSS